MTMLRDAELTPHSDTNPVAVRTGLRALTASFAAVAAGNYADDDVISNDADEGEGDPLEFENVVRAAGGAAKIVGGHISMSEDGILATSELFLFSQAPTASEMDDNAAFAGVGAADLPFYLGSVAFDALADVGAGSFALPTTLTPAAPLLVHCEATSLFGILVLRDAETNESASMEVSITLYVE
jgi:hypothetical protein